MTQMSFDDDGGRDNGHIVRLGRNPNYPDDMTIGEARARLAIEMQDGIPTSCPCCGCLAHVAKRSIHTAQARGLILIARAGGIDDYVDTALITRSNARMDVAKSKWWGLLEELEEKRDDGGRAGWWRFSPFGRRFVMREATVQKYAHTFDNAVHWRSGPQVTIEDCLRNRFDWWELMYGD